MRTHIDYFKTVIPPFVGFSKQPLKHMEQEVVFMIDGGHSNYALDLPGLERDHVLELIAEHDTQLHSAAAGTVKHMTN